MGVVSNGYRRCHLVYLWLTNVVESSAIDYKWARGFDPALVHSVHYISHPELRKAVSQYIEYETESNMELKEYLLQQSAVGSGFDRGVRE